MSIFKGEFEVSDKYYWWKSKSNTPPIGTRYCVYGVLATLEEPEPKEIDRCDLVLFFYGSRDGMLEKLKREKKHEKA